MIDYYGTLENLSDFLEKWKMAVLQFNILFVPHLVNLITAACETR